MNNKNIKVVDEHNIDRNAIVMFGFVLEGSEYVSYWIERDVENSNIFISKVIKNIDGTFNMMDIEDTSEKSKLVEILKALITNSVESQNDKLLGESVTLADGKVIKFIPVAFNKEQRLNVQKTYVTTVKKEVVRVAEKYYYMDIVMEQPKVEENIFPTIPTVTEPAAVFPEVPVTPIPAVIETPVVVETPAVAPVVPEPVVVANPTPIPVVTAEVTPSPVVVEPITVPLTQTVPVVETPVVAATPVVETPVVAQVVPEPVIVETPVTGPTLVQPVAEPATVVMPDPNQPLVFNASKETNLNAALGEVANTTAIPVENIQPVRDFGVDAPVQAVPVAAQVIAPMQQPEVAAQDASLNKKAGFANSKFFMVVAVAFFLASCIFLGYEVFSYFQLTK